MRSFRSYSILVLLAFGGVGLGCSGGGCTDWKGGTGGEDEGGSGGEVATGGMGGGGSGGVPGTGGKGGAGGAVGGAGGQGGAMGGKGGSAGGDGGLTDVDAAVGGSGGEGGSDGGTATDAKNKDAGASADMGTAGPFKLMGTDFTMMGTRLCFKNGQTSATGNKSPSFAWTGVPAGAMSLALTMVDTKSLRTHWVIWDISPTEAMLVANLPPERCRLHRRRRAARKCEKRAFRCRRRTLTSARAPSGDAGIRKYDFQLWAVKVAKLPTGSMTTNQIRETLLPANSVGSSTVSAYGNDLGEVSVSVGVKRWARFAPAAGINLFSPCRSLDRLTSRRRLRRSPCGRRGIHG